MSTRSYRRGTKSSVSHLDGIVATAVRFVVCVALGFPLIGGCMSSNSSSSPCSVTILTPYGTCVGAVRDARTITLEASVTPSLPSATYAWAVVRGPGDGIFNPPDAQTSEFQGTVKGKVVVEVVVSTARGTCEAIKDLVVIEISDLPTLTPQVMEEHYLVGATSVSVVIPYTASTGDLRRVLIGPPSDTNPYQWYLDFNAEVAHLDGDVTLTFVRDGEYFVQTLRVIDEGLPSEVYTEDVFAIYYNSADGTEQEHRKECKTGATETQPKPSADLVLISDSTKAGTWVEESQ